MPATKPKSRTDRRKLVVEAAAELFSERPFDEVSMADIADRAGVAYGLVAHYFENKRGVYVEAMREIAGRLRNVRDTPPPGNTPAEQIRSGIARHVAYLDQSPELFQALMRSGIGADPEVRQVIHDLRWEAAEIILLAVGAERPIRPALRNAMAGWVALFNESVLDRMASKDISRTALVELVISALGSNLAAAAAVDKRIVIDHKTVDELRGG